MFLGSLYCKQYGPRLDCSHGSSLIRVHIVDFYEKSCLKCSWIYGADLKSRQHFKDRKLPAKLGLKLKAPIWHDCLKCTWIYGADIKSRQHFKDRKIPVKLGLKLKAPIWHDCSRRQILCCPSWFSRNNMSWHFRIHIKTQALYYQNLKMSPAAGIIWRIKVPFRMNKLIIFINILIHWNSLT